MYIWDAGNKMDNTEICSENYSTLITGRVYVLVRVRVAFSDSYFLLIATLRNLQQVFVKF
jgi:hypothetical protein